MSEAKSVIEAAMEDSLDRRRLSFTNQHKLLTTQSSSEPAFLPFHLKLLQALYADRSNEFIDDMIFESIHHFLNNRQHVVKAKKEALRLKGIHEQATKLSDTEREKQLVADEHLFARKRKSTSPQYHASPILSLSMQSPHMMMHMHPATRNEPFGMVARLLHLRYQRSQLEFENKANLYKELLNAVQCEITNLEEQLAESRSKFNERMSKTLEQLLSTSSHQEGVDTNKSLRNDKSISDMEGQSQAAELAFTIRLWQQLDLDLKQMLCI
ncbi:hypothetical protein MPSEU_000501000 [Mayamaea pseudoterrestris]|nr:hypothetical protein MPSEU_000501000 [Mayamaea pseudoterrestris]